MENNKKLPGGKILSVIILVLCLAMMLGIKLLFHACPANPDGTYPTCHWAQEMVFFVAIISVVLAITMVGVRDSHMKMALAIAIIPTMIVAAITPDNAIAICTEGGTACQNIMRPVVIGISIVVIAVSVFAIPVHYKDAHKNDPKKGKTTV